MTSTPLPRYQQIVEELLDQIERGELAAGDRLPSERSLSEHFDVNRRTLRNALDVLQRRGLVERRQGAGTFVTSPRFERKAAEFFPFTEGIRHRGFEPGSKIISLQKLPASPSVAEQLELAEKDKVWRFHRLRSINGEPFLVETFSLPAAIAPAINEFDLSDRSVYDVLEHEYGVIIEMARLSLTTRGGPSTMAMTCIEATAFASSPMRPHCLRTSPNTTAPEWPHNGDSRYRRREELSAVPGRGRDAGAGIHQGRNPSPGTRLRPAS